MLIPLIFLLALVAGVIALVRWLWAEAPRQAPGRGVQALDVLDERYARGEIEREEYLRRREDIEARRA